MDLMMDKKNKDSNTEEMKISETILNYQELYNRDPSSKIFAPLAEAYRKANQHEMALKIATQGVSEHPGFASGLVTLARILIDTKEYDPAITYLKTAVDLSPDNFLAHKLLGETYIKLMQPSKALKVFKMALYLDPLDVFAKKMVKKLESISAADFNEDIVITNSADNQCQQSSNDKKRSLTSHSVDRYISLIDAFISRNDFDKATETLTEAFENIGKTPELQRRQIFLSKRFADSSQNINDIDTKANLQLKVLNKLLSQIEDRRIY